MKQRSDPSTKPYYKCLSCPRFRKICAGLPTRDMDIKNWCEYVRDVMDAFHLSCDYVAENSDSSKKTIERIRSVSIDQDIMRGTSRRVEIVVFGHAARHICDIEYDRIEALEAEVASLRADNAYWRAENDRKAKIIDKLL